MKNEDMSWQTSKYFLLLSYSVNKIKRYQMSLLLMFQTKYLSNCDKFHFYVGTIGAELNSELHTAYTFSKSAFSSSNLLHTYIFRIVRTLLNTSITKNNWKGIESQKLIVKLMKKKNPLVHTIVLKDTTKKK